MNNDQNNNIINGNNVNQMPVFGTNSNPNSNLVFENQINRNQFQQQSQVSYSNVRPIVNNNISENQISSNQQIVNSIDNKEKINNFSSSVAYNFENKNLEVSSNQNYTNTQNNDNLSNNNISNKLSNNLTNNNISNKSNNNLTNNNINNKLSDNLTNNNINNQSNDNSITNNDIVSVKKYLLYMILFCIPVVGLIMLLIKAFSKNENKNISNYAKANLIFYLITTIFSVVFIGLMVALYIGTIKSAVEKPMYNEQFNNIDNSKFNGILNYRNYGDLNNTFSYSVPDVFEDESISSSLHYTYGNESIFGDCIFELNSISNYTSAKTLVDEMIEYYDIENKETKKINRINWYSFVYEDSFGKEYYYATDINNIVYLYQFEIKEDDLLEKCTNYHNSIINSIKLK